MSINRQDSWTEKEDVLLAETVLRCIRKGSTQLAAFEEVGKKLSRTPAACGFRWNGLLRKQYESAIKTAKEERKELSKTLKIRRSHGKPQVQDNLVEIKDLPLESITLKDVISFLKGLKFNKDSPNSLLEERCSLLETELAEANKQNGLLTHSLDQLLTEHKLIKEDYKKLISIINQVNKLMSIDNDESEPSPFILDPTIKSIK